MRGHYLYVPLETAQTPAEGHAYVNMWWSAHPEKGVAFYVSRLSSFECGEPTIPAPQCNDSEHIAKSITERLHPECSVVFLPVVFAAHARRELLALCKAARAKGGE